MVGLDVVVFKIIEQHIRRRRIFLLGAQRFCILAELSYFLIMLSQYYAQGLSQASINNCFIAMCIVTTYNLVYYQYFKIKIKAELRNRRRMLDENRGNLSEFNEESQEENQLSFGMTTLMDGDYLIQREGQEIDDCPICMEILAGVKEGEGYPMPEEPKQVKTLDCSHAFHKECITHWLNTRDFCPLCRSRVNLR